MALIDGLIDYYKLDEASAGAVGAHASLTLTDNNTVGASTGKINGCRSFNGTNEYFSRSSLLTGTGSFSISVWANASSTSGYRTIVGGTRTSTSGTWGDAGSIYLQYRDDTGRWAFIIKNTAGNLGQVNGNLRSTGWRHFVATYNSSTGAMVLYENGVSVGSTTLSGTRDTAGAIHVGAGQFAGAVSDFWPGLIDEFGLWGRVLDSSEVTALYNSGNGFAYPFTKQVSAANSEAAEAADAHTATRSPAAASTDSAETSDTHSAELAALADHTEATEASDEHDAAIISVVTAATSDQAEASETQSAVASLLAAISAAAEAGEITMAQAALLATVTEAAAAGDQFDAVVIRRAAVTESVAAAEVVECRADLAAAVAEGVLAGDQFAGLKGVAASVLGAAGATATFVLRGTEVASADIRSPDYTLYGPRRRRYDIEGPRLAPIELSQGKGRITLDGTR